MASPPVSPPTNAFSPIKVHDSPCYIHKGNLTGSPRKVKDSIADIFNAIQKWNNLHADGLVLLRRISEDLPNSFETSEEENNRSERLQKKFLMLADIKNKMVEVVEIFRTVQSHFQSLEILERLNRKCELPTFLTWPISEYVELAEQVHISYNNQLKLNIHVIENLALVTQKSAECLIALWIHQPYIDKIINFRMDCALRETGFS